MLNEKSFENKDESLEKQLNIWSKVCKLFFEIDYYAQQEKSLPSANSLSSLLPRTAFHFGSINLSTGLSKH